MESVAVVGAGSIGLLLLQVARLCGAGRLIAVDPIKYRRDLASSLGADAAVSSWEGVHDLTNGRGVDVVLEATDSPDGPQHAAQSRAHRRAARAGGHPRGGRVYPQRLAGKAQGVNHQAVAADGPRLPARG